MLVCQEQKLAPRRKGLKGCTRAYAVRELPPDMISCHSDCRLAPLPPLLSTQCPQLHSRARGPLSHNQRPAVAVCGPNSNSQRLGHPQHTPQTDTAPQDTALRIPHALTYSAGTLAHHSLATARTQRRVTNLKAWGRARICLLCVSGLPLASPVLPPVPLPRDYCPTEHDHHSSL